MSKFKLQARKVFDISTQKGLKKAEKYQQTLYKRFDVVNINPIAFEKVELSGVKK